MARLDNVDLRLLRVLMAVVEGRGFAAAQAELNVGASTISNHMSALETRLGVKVCTRGRSGFRLTPDGEMIYAEAQRLFAAIDAFQFKVGTLKSSVRASLTIGIIDNTISDINAPLHDLIGAFEKQNPNMLLSIECRPPNQLLREVFEKRLDVAIGSFPKSSDNLKYQELYKERHQLYCGRNHPLFGLDDDLISQKMLADFSIVSRGYWGGRRNTRFPSDKTLAKVNNIEAEARLILSGSYLGYLPDHYASQWVVRGDLRAILPGQLCYDAPFEIAYASSSLERPIVARFIERTTAFFGKIAPRT